MGSEQSSANTQEFDDDTIVSAQTGPASVVRLSLPADPNEPRDTWIDEPRTAPRLLRSAIRAILAFFARPFVRSWELLDKHLARPPLTATLPPSPPLPKSQNASTPDQVAERLLDDLFLLPEAYAKTVRRVAEHAEYLQGLPEDERIADMVHFAASRLAQNPLGLVPIAWIRARLSRVDRFKLNRALVQLRDEKEIELISLGGDNAAIIAGGLVDPQGNHVTHFKVRNPR